MTNEIIIDATGGIMGRIASFAAKQSLLGKEVRIVNCNDVLITGAAKTTIKGYKDIRDLGGWNQYGPNFPRVSEKIMKRTVRGMLPKMERGIVALKMVKCYNEIPSEFEGKKMINMKKELKVKAIKLRQLTKELKN